MTYDTAITNGREQTSDAWLEAMRELEQEAYNDAPDTRVADAVTPMALEALASLARQAFGEANEASPAAPRLLSNRDDEAFRAAGLVVTVPYGP